MKLGLVLGFTFGPVAQSDDTSSFVFPCLTMMTQTPRYSVENGKPEYIVTCSSPLPRHSFM
uniref:Uncharacterized protein n=1 Tax=Tarenaya spinosa TaxID=228870 RepID=Q1KUP7_9ROSI|nr:hypothetical protein [Tarenaya spinosa]